MDIQSIAMQIIVNAGDAKSSAFKALKYAKEGEFHKAEKSLKNCKEKILSAHKIQTDMLQKEAGGDNVEVNLLMVHAQDHLMNSILAKDLIEEMVSLYSRLNNNEENSKAETA
ncbi:PTS lactose/cellobiose transporter subunit IIA [Thermohalobacter berrensis]|uniref:PTS cellobiose transporter subunit IIA n=1 Tax=Thermohalobacter berrensis TaxID=99594 RepID=A0A419T418_9FIRM|nr:PTS lactose/cellobiose transporter subunit IIA [Thermohalobacter berrensis]RKD32307.1 PTS cellobiose transporter subunit IIA [Thermohalobacter berrensis]